MVTIVSLYLKFMFSHVITVTLIIGFILGIKPKFMGLTYVGCWEIRSLSMRGYGLGILANCIASYLVMT